MADERTSKVVLQYALDKSALAQVEAGTIKLELRIKAITQAQDQVTETAKPLIAAMRAAFQDPGDRAVKRVNELRDAYKAANDEANTQTQSNKSILGADGLRRTGGALTQLGLGPAGDVVSRLGDLGQVNKEFDTLGVGSKALSTGLIAVTAVVTATKLAIDQMNKDLEPTAKLLEIATTSLDAYYAAIQEGTTESIQKQIEASKLQKEAVDAELAQLQQSMSNAFASEQGAFGGDLGARIKFAAAGTNAEFAQDSEAA
jgi:chaperonin cofactor prefoldin